jgi:hypothetical protein
MTREETKRIIRIMCATYPNFKPNDLSETVDTWDFLLEEYTYQEISLALKAYIATSTSGFAPSIGQLIEKVRSISCGAELSEMQAWALVSDALRNSSYHAEEEFAKLPEIVQKAVGSPNLLRSWATTDERSIENVLQSNFMRTYRAELSRKREVQTMPKDVLAIMEQRQQGLIEG